MQVEAEELLIGSWRLSPSLNRLYRNGKSHQLEPRLTKLLNCLHDHSGEVLTRQFLHENVWKDAIVSEDSLSRAISDLRKIFSPDDTIQIETIRKVGYRFLVDASQEEENETWSKAASIILAAVLITAALGFTVYKFLGKSESTHSELRATPFTSLPGMEFDPSPSPSGEHVAFVWNGNNGDNWDIYIKQVGIETPTRFTKERNFERSPFGALMESTLPT